MVDVDSWVWFILVTTFVGFELCCFFTVFCFPVEALLVILGSCGYFIDL